MVAIEPMPVAKRAWGILNMALPVCLRGDGVPVAIQLGSGRGPAAEDK